METPKATYLGNLKPIGENGLRIRIYAEKLEDHWETDDKGRKYIDGIINPNKNGADQYGYTHYMKLNTYKPNGKGVANSKTDLPF